MKPKIDANKKYTSGGNPVELLHRAPEGWPSIYVWYGVVDNCVRIWDDEGRHDAQKCNPLRDLIEVREPLEVMVVVNCHGKPEAITTSTIDGWDSSFPKNAPHTLRRFREVIE